MLYVIPLTVQLVTNTKYIQLTVCKNEACVVGLLTEFRRTAKLRQGSHSTWKTWKTWKNESTPEKPGNIMEF